MCACSNNENSSQKNFIGNIKSVIEKEYTIKIVNNTIQTDSFIHSINLTYNRNGCLTRKQKFNSDKRLIIDNKMRINQSNKCEEIECFNEKGETIENIHYLYDDNNYLVFESTVDTSKIIVRQSMYINNEKGKLIRKIIYSNGDTPEKTIEYKYNKFKNTSEEHHFLKGSDHILHYYTKYDSQRNPTEFKLIDEFGETLENMSFSYKYDSKKNWINKIEYHNGVPFRMFLRELKFY
ncbi:MAG: hypothetical protein R2852_07510 [Bacteroidia bacterium]